MAGYKTYIVAGGTIAYGVIGYLLNYHDGSRAIELVMMGLGFAGVRHGVTTESQK
jgi:hypothetical protein